MMARWFTVLIALVAQGMALMAPVCLIRCVSPDGHECVELVGQGCNCCGCRTNEPSPQICAVAKCGDHCHDHDEEQEAPEGFQVRCDDCSCQHSRMESAPQNLSKSLVADVLSPWHDVLLAPMTLSVTDIRVSEDAGLPPLLLRPQASPHLTVLATIVLRV